MVSRGSMVAYRSGNETNEKTPHRNRGAEVSGWNVFNQVLLKIQ